MSAPNPVIKGDSTILWGTGSVYSGGLVVSATLTKNAEAQEVADTNGFAAAVVFFNNKQDIECEIIIQTAAPSIEIGDAVSICGVTGCIVQPGGFQQMWEQKGVRKCRLKATKYTNF